MNARFDLTGRTVIVTGGGKGIGKVYAQEFAKAGARMVAADVDGAAAKAVAEALAAEGFATLGLATDIAVEEWDRVMAVNLRGMFLSCRAVFPAMKAQQRGKISSP